MTELSTERSFMCNKKIQFRWKESEKNKQKKNIK